MKRNIPLSAIRHLAVLFPGGLHELAVFVLKAYDALDREANAQNPRTIRQSRPTLHGLAALYAHMTGIALRRVEGMLVEARFDLGAIVEFDTADSANASGLPQGQFEQG